jgi:hypothetical protein
MRLIIRIKNGQPYEHPMLEENFIQAFPDADLTDLPAEFAWFERVPAPVLGVYQRNQRAVYQLCTDGMYRDVWYCDNMTAEEIKEKQDAVKAYWASKNGYASWVFNEQSCSFLPPVPYPEDGKQYFWDEESVSWIEVSQTPNAE